ncbi:MAG: DUF1361 domain-containing protein [Oculatellaceae cyanobacterium Prado106]|jgi:uncharacterized membrane protein|nr:DUF1361 domain-containing protein [Oculatellaceae cyanobacterium Prado106]
MRSLINEVILSLSSVYSGWIFWNLFLAFIPLVLSFILFRRKSLRQSWLWWFSLVSLGIGAVGFLPKFPFVADRLINLVQRSLSGDVSTRLILLSFLTLAVIALGLSVVLFKRPRTLRSGFWWAGLVVFIAFLPNAPYLLTDIIHLLRAADSDQISTWVVVSVVVPTHATAILLGFEAYVISLMNQGHYLKYHGAKSYVFLGELIVHALCAIGVYLGRFVRFNSWDLVTDPGNVFLTTLDTLTAKRPVFVICIIFVVLTVLYWVMKQLTIGVKLRWQTARLGDDGLD